MENIKDAKYKGCNNFMNDLLKIKQIKDNCYILKINNKRVKKIYTKEEVLNYIKEFMLY